MDQHEGCLHIALVMEGEFTLKKAEKWRNGENAVGRIQMTSTRVNPQKQETKFQSSLKHMSMCGSDQEGEKIRAVAKAEMHIEIRLHVHRNM